MASLVVDVTTGGNADAANLRGEGVREVVAVEVHGGNDIKLRGAGEDLLEGNVGNGVLDKELLLPLAVGVGAADAAEDALDLINELLLLGIRHHVVAGLDGLGVLDGIGGAAVVVVENPALALGDDLVAELTGGDAVAPVLEAALGKLHDVALVDESDAAAALLEGVLDGSIDETGSALARDGLDADARRLGEADLVSNTLLLEKSNDVLGILAAGSKLDAGVNVLGVLAEDDHVDIAGALDGRGDAVKVLDGAEADVEIELLAKSDVEGAEAAANWGGQGALDADEVLAVGIEGGSREPLAGLAECLFASKNLEPLNLALAVVGLGHGRVKDVLRGAPDVGASAVALNKGNDGIVGDLEDARLVHGDGRGKADLAGQAGEGRAEAEKSHGAGAGVNVRDTCLLWRLCWPPSSSCLQLPAPVLS
eukprot:m.287411 g.287411  ORF g.287411 m.287411 type:complete len:424 (+) comp11770_c0_seq1:400-1671(+)